MKPHCVIAFLLAAAHAAHAYQLDVVANATWSAFGNGTEFNLHKVWNWPLEVNGPEDAAVRPPVYGYVYNPMAPVACPGTDAPNVAVCQKADQFYNAGTRDLPLMLWSGHWPGQTAPGRECVVTVLYPGGSSWRASNVTYVHDPSVSPPAFEMTGEHPYLLYNFIFRGDLSAAFLSG